MNREEFIHKYLLNDEEKDFKDRLMGLFNFISMQIAKEHEVIKNNPGRYKIEMIVDFCAVNPNSIKYEKIELIKLYES